MDIDYGLDPTDEIVYVPEPVICNKYQLAGRYYATVDKVEVASDIQISDETFKALRPHDQGSQMSADARYMELAHMAADRVFVKLGTAETLVGKTLADVVFKVTDHEVSSWQ